VSSKRSIFVEADSTDKAFVPVPGAIDAGGTAAHRAISAWLTVLLGLVVCLILAGGLTRLTDSGLAITEWKPLAGALPPTTAQAWEEEFRKYRTIPEYQLQNKGMSLAEFKTIYWWEWGHRQLARLVGLVWAAGFLWFLLRRQIPPGWAGRLLLPGVCGAVQGGLGWWMVSSGLTGRMVDVASCRLAMHLGLAFVILGLVAWYRWQMLRSATDLFRASRHRDRAFVRVGTVFVALVFGQIILGALVAGIDAGRSYAQWPLMAEGEFLPSGAFDLVPLWANFTQNAALVQFNHRMLGYGVLLYAAWAWWRARRHPNGALRRACARAGAAVLVQAVIGIITIVTAAPWHVAIVHQFGAVVVLISVLHARFLAAYPMAQGIR